jgi:sigma-B regulation protein RsbQ
VDIRSRNNLRELGRPDGPVLLLAHGFGCDQGMWRRILPRFIDRYRVVLFDHVGSGNSDIDSYDPQKYAAIDGYADDVLEICEALDLTDVTLVAHSVSSMMAVTAAARTSSRLVRLVLVAPSPSYIDDPATGYEGGFSSDDIDELLDSLDSNHLAWAAAMAPTVMGTPESPELEDELEVSFCRMSPVVARGFARVTFLTDVRATLARVPVPTLILQCTADALAPPSVGHYLHRTLPCSELVLMKATGHCPHVSAPEETTEAILAFLSAG